MKPAEKTGRNEHRKYNYVELSGYMEAARKPLAENGLAVVQLFEDAEGSPVLLTQLLHESGQSIESRLRLFPTSDYHALGSACTYSRKYALAALLGIVAEGEDDDGEAAMSPSPKASAGAKSRSYAGKKGKPPQDPIIGAVALIDKVEGAREMLAAKDIDPRELVPQVVEKIHEMGVAGLKKKVAEWRKEQKKEEKAAEEKAKSESPEEEPTEAEAA